MGTCKLLRSSVYLMLSCVFEYLLSHSTTLHMLVLWQGLKGSMVGKWEGNHGDLYSKLLCSSVYLMSSCVFEYLSLHISVALVPAMGPSAIHFAMLMYVFHGICNESHENTEIIEHPEGSSSLKALRPPHGRLMLLESHAISRE